MQLEGRPLLLPSQLLRRILPNQIAAKRKGRRGENLQVVGQCSEELTDSVIPNGARSPLETSAKGKSHRRNAG